MYITVDDVEQTCSIRLVIGEKVDDAKENAFRILGLFGLRITASLTVYDVAGEVAFHIPNGQ